MSWQWKATSTSNLVTISFVVSVSRLLGHKHQNCRNGRYGTTGIKLFFCSSVHSKKVFIFLYLQILFCVLIACFKIFLIAKVSLLFHYLVLTVCDEL